MKAKLNIALHLAIDFTKSNGLPHSPQSLHHYNPVEPDNRNPYQGAIESVVDILLDYDSDKKVPVYGFGAETKFPNLTSGGVSHCFPCTGNLEGDEVNGIKEILKVYTEALSQIILSGPTFFAPIFKMIIEKTKAKIADPKNYTFFMIITDGELNDFQLTVDALVEASELPISIVIVGVGEESFEEMKKLDTGMEKNYQGKKPVRDILHFTKFNDFKNNRDALAADVLSEIPKQVEEYYAMKNLTPKLLEDPPIPGKEYQNRLETQDLKSEASIKMSEGSKSSGFGYSLGYVAPTIMGQIFRPGTRANTQPNGDDTPESQRGLIPKDNSKKEVANSPSTGSGNPKGTEEISINLRAGTPNR